MTLIAVALIGAAAATVIALVRMPIYRARTSVRLEALNDKYLNLGDAFPVSSLPTNPSTESYMHNELKILQSDTLANRVADRLGITGDHKRFSLMENILARFERGRQLSSPDDLRIQAVKRALTVRTSLQSQIVEVFFDSSDPELAARGANTVASEYVAMNREARLQVAQDTTEWLTGRIADLKEKLDKGTHELQAFARSSGLLLSSNQTSNQLSLSEQGVRQIQDELSRAQTDRAAKHSRYLTAISNSPESLPTGSDGGLLHEQQAALAGLYRELTQLRTRYTPAHYKVKDVEARIAQVEVAIKLERQHVLERLHADYESADRLERVLASRYRDQSRKLEVEAGDALRYNVLKGELDNTRHLYDSLLQKVKEAGVASALRATSIRVIDAARPSATPYAPNIALNCAIGLSCGLFFGLGFVVVRERGDQRLKEPGDCRLPNVRELGVIPSAKRTLSLQRASSVELVTWHQEPSLLTESFRATLASILFSAGSKRTQGILAVTSVETMEGKTTITTNLGIALTETNRRVLLVDADLRRPRLHAIFDQCNDTGLTTVLTAKHPIAELNSKAFAQPTSVPGLFVLPSGPGVPSITNLLYSDRLPQLLARAREEFDYVLIDTPPMALFSDARIIGKLSDSVILVLRASKTSREQLQATCLQFMEDGTPVLGTVLNHWNANQRARSLYHGYR
jgi:capsular exopolysaccharide synthesis family protein